MTYSEPPVTHCDVDKAAAKAARKAAKRERKAALANGEVLEHEKTKKAKVDIDDCQDQTSTNCDKKILERRKAYMKEHKMSMEGNDIEQFFPFYSFSEAPFPDQAQEVISRYERPTPIQAASWPIILKGRDIIGIAETGSGKTMAFALPSLVHIDGAKHKQPKVLVLAPTRELALQISAEFVSLKVRQVCLYGGTSKGPQLEGLRSKPHVIVATPGRLQDMVEGGHCDLSQVSYAVLDEADRMLDIGFEIPTRQILKLINAQRQIIMFSATWPTGVQKLAGEFLRDPVKLTVGSDQLTANVRIKQTVEIIDDNNKDKRLLQLLQDFKVGSHSRVLIFVLYKKDAPYVQGLLGRKGYTVGALHGNSSQAAREKTISQFKCGEIPIMVATDVASRGLDVDDVEHVINYSMPLTIADYIHRIGRTARAGKNGIAHSFFVHSADRNLGWHAARVLREAGQPVPPELEKYGPPAVKQEEKTCNISEVKAAPKIVFDDSDDE
eukprot:EG_transcript_7901